MLAPNPGDGQDVRTLHGSYNKGAARESLLWHPAVRDQRCCCHVKHTRCPQPAPTPLHPRPPPPQEGSPAAEDEKPRSSTCPVYSFLSISQYLQGVWRYLLPTHALSSSHPTARVRRWEPSLPSLNPSWFPAAWQNYKLLPMVFEAPARTCPVGMALPVSVDLTCCLLHPAHCPPAGFSPAFGSLWVMAGCSPPPALLSSGTSHGTGDTLLLQSQHGEQPSLQDLQKLNESVFRDGEIESPFGEWGCSVPGGGTRVMERRLKYLGCETRRRHSLLRALTGPDRLRSWGGRKLEGGSVGVGTGCRKGGSILGGDRLRKRGLQPGKDRLSNGRSILGQTG